MYQYKYNCITKEEIEKGLLDAEEKEFVDRIKHRYSSFNEVIIACKGIGYENILEYVEYINDKLVFVKLFPVKNINNLHILIK